MFREPLGRTQMAQGAQGVVAGQARLGADAEHPSVDVGGDAGDHLGGRGAQALGPVAADDVVVGADAAGGDDHGLGGEFELSGRVAAGGDAAR
ncbi:hypothetical protein B0E38_07402 [Streptomyces sp. 111WW2]|nr:hypothetical protein B0E38_07402 [Streptomyces sp. 111WW2]